MSIFGKKETDMDLVSQIKSLTEENNALKEQIGKFETLAKLSSKADALGYSGSVKELFEQLGNDYTATLEAMIEGRLDSQTKVDSDKNLSEFLESANKSVGDSMETKDDEPKTGAEAVSQIKSLTGATTREATAQARTKYPHLFRS